MDHLPSCEVAASAASSTEQILQPLPHEYLEPCGGPVGKMITWVWSSLRNNIKRLQKPFKIALSLLGAAIFFIYLGFVVKTYIDRGKPLDWCYGYGRAFLLFGLIIWLVAYYNLIQPHVIAMAGSTMNVTVSRIGWVRYIRISAAGAFLAAYITIILYDSWGQGERQRSLLGIASFILIGAIFSKHPDFIRWDSLLFGLSLHLIIGTITIKFETGRNIVQCIGRSVVSFLECGYNGASFVYGKVLVDDNHVFAFESLSVLYFLSAVVQVLFYLGWLQKVCFKVGGLIQIIMGTTVIESVNSVTTIFLGMSEAPLLYSQYIALLTPSEMHAIMTGGFATVAGTLLAAYTGLGIDPKNVITASTMAAPAALTFGKLFYPENRKSQTSSANIEMIRGYEQSIIDAACAGAFSAIGIVASIIAMVIASVSLVAFINQSCIYIGSLVGVNDFTFDFMLGKVFIPLAWLMGVKIEECSRVASLIGLKTFINEFVAYQKLGEYKRNNELSARSEAIATFALCGFANPGALASNIALLRKLAPGQSTVITKVALRAFIAGSVTSLTSATIAGLLMTESEEYIGHNSTSNSTYHTY